MSAPEWLDVTDEPAMRMTDSEARGFKYGGLLFGVWGLFVGLLLGLVL